MSGDKDKNTEVDETLEDNDAEKDDETTDEEDSDAEVNGGDDDETERSFIKGHGAEYDTFDELFAELKRLKELEKKGVDPSPKAEEKKTTEEKKYELFQRKVIDGALEKIGDKVDRKTLAKALDDIRDADNERHERLTGHLLNRIVNLEWKSVDTRLRDIVKKSEVIDAMSDNPKLAGDIDAAIKWVIMNDDAKTKKMLALQKSSEKRPLPKVLQGRSQGGSKPSGKSYKDFMKGANLDTDALFDKLGPEEGDKQYNLYLQSQIRRK